MQALCGLALTASAVEMYRWVDERGHTNVSDVVPERYRGSAQRIDSSKFELSEAQRKDAATRATARARTASSVVAPASRAASSPLATAPASIGRSPPPVTGAAESDCAALNRQYLAAVAVRPAEHQVAFGALGERHSGVVPETSTIETR